jgi:hypothetical protein
MKILLNIVNDTSTSMQIINLKLFLLWARKNYKILYGLEIGKYATKI